MTVSCPKCTSQRVWRAGHYRGRQRWLCRSCNFRFSKATGSEVELNVSGQSLVLSETIHDFGEFNSVNVSPSDKGLKNTSFAVGKDIRSHDFTIVGKTINSLLHNCRESRVCAEKSEAKNLASNATTKAGVDARRPTMDVTVKGKIIEYAWWLKKEGYADSTIRMRSRNLKRLVKLGANIFDHESVKETIANQNSWCTNTKANIVDAYHTFVRMLGLTWTPPRYKAERTYPFIPIEAEIDALIASCGSKTATFLQTLKETSMRAGEAFSLEWADIDMERRLINLKRPEKGSNPRIFKVSKKLIDMLNALQRKSKKVFGDVLLGSIRATFCASRKRAAKKLANPRILKISFHTFRHWKATMEYHRTKDIMHVMAMLGHKRIINTQIYINLEQTIFNDGDNSEYTTRVAKTVKGARALLGAGFDYVTDMDGYKLFRKRK